MLTPILSVTVYSRGNIIETFIKNTALRGLPDNYCMPDVYPAIGPGKFPLSIPVLW